jgi:hypothetical protein
LTRLRDAHVERSGQLQPKRQDITMSIQKTDRDECFKKLVQADKLLFQLLYPEFDEDFSCLSADQLWRHQALRDWLVIEPRCEALLTQDSLPEGVLDAGMEWIEERGGDNYQPGEALRRAFGE